VRSHKFVPVNILNCWKDLLKNKMCKHKLPHIESSNLYIYIYIYIFIYIPRTKAAAKFGQSAKRCVKGCERQRRKWWPDGGWKVRESASNYFLGGRVGRVGAAVDSSWILNISFNLELRDADSWAAISALVLHRTLTSRHPCIYHSISTVSIPAH